MKSTPAPAPAQTLEATAHQAAQLTASAKSEHHHVGTLSVRIALDESGLGEAGPAVSPSTVQQAWSAVLRSSAALRVRFHDAPGRLLQEPRDYDDLPQETTHVSVGDTDDDTDGFAPFGPVLLTARLDLGGQHPELVVRIHQALTDEHSVPLIEHSFRHALTHLDADPAERNVALSAILAAAEKIFNRPIEAAENFFDLGGNSLAALRLIALAQAEGFHLMVDDVFDLPDMRALAASAVPTSDSLD
ncbi:phosphopantetheine-binding protein [Streptomyces sp. NBC_01261]|uniref:phosphopantetheine-binding protein n=1 Tax=Streptomyces sp. NBC_01261 TaxID=2903802 RepID=UPI002E361B25|nr:phosphopantetheine-binding protein [Streptomyces sp. NBC_01261]